MENNNPIPKTTEEVLAALRAGELVPAEATRRKRWVIEELTKLEREAWNHELEAEYGRSTIPAINDLIGDNQKAVAKHQEIIDDLNNPAGPQDPNHQNLSNKQKREMIRASEGDIRALEEQNKKRRSFIQDLEKVAASRDGKADEVKMRMKFISEKFASLFEADAPLTSSDNPTGSR